MKEQQQQAIAEELGDIAENVKAEIVVAAALEAGVPLQQITIEHAGSFTRPYRKDILAVSIADGGTGKPSLKVQLSRNGLYDLLPEALSHSQQVEDRAGNGVRALSEDHKRRKKEEAQARRFFRPLENEFFYQGVRLEQEEQELVYHSNSAFYQFLTEFWGITDTLSPAYEAALLRLLPVIHTISGDFEGIRACLESLLQVPVYYQIEHRTLGVEATHNQLGKGKLGQSFTVGCFVHGVPFAVFTLGPVPLHQLVDYLPGGQTDRFLQKFLSYTVPLEAEVETKILSGRNESGSGNTSLGVIGYSASL